MAGPTRSKNYLKGLTSGYARMFVQVTVGLWLVPFTLHYLDRERYAVFSLTLSVLTWLGLLDLGITGGLRIQAARMTGKPDQAALNRLASSAFFAQGVVVLGVLLVGGGVSFAFPHFFKVGPELAHEAKIVCLWTVIGAAMSVGSQTFSALLIAHQQVHVDNLIGFILIAVRTVVTVVLLKMGWGLYSLAAAHVSARLVTGVLAVVRTYRLIPGLQIRYSLASWESLRSMMNLGVWFTLGSIAGIAIGSLDSIVSAKVVSMETVTTLTLTSRMYDFIGSLVFVITETARPMLGQMLGEGKIPAALRAYRHLFTLSTGFAVVASLAVWAGNSAFVTRWTGAVNYGGLAVDIALALNLILHMWVMPNRAVLSANLAVRPQVLSRLLEGGLNLGLSIWLGEYWGLFGILIATCIAGAVSSMWILPYLTAKMFKRPFLKFVWEDALPMGLLFVILAPVAVLGRYLATSLMGFGGALVGSALTGGVGLIVFWFVVCDESLRARLPWRAWCEQKLPAPLRAWIFN